MSKAQAALILGLLLGFIAGALAGIWFERKRFFHFLQATVDRLAEERVARREEGKLHGATPPARAEPESPDN